MGALVSRAQLAAVREGLAYLKAQAETLHDGATHPLVDADAAVACCVGPTLLGTRNAAGSDASDRVHDTEVFGPVATLVPYRDAAHALALVARGQGSLVASFYGSDAKALAAHGDRARAAARSRARDQPRGGGPPHRPRQRDAAVAARRPGPRRWRRRTGWPARTELLPPPHRHPGRHSHAGRNWPDRTRHRGDTP